MPNCAATSTRSSASSSSSWKFNSCKVCSAFLCWLKPCQQHASIALESIPVVKQSRINPFYLTPLYVVISLRRHEPLCSLCTTIWQRQIRKYSIFCRFSAFLFAEKLSIYEYSKFKFLYQEYTYSAGMFINGRVDGCADESRNAENGRNYSILVHGVTKNWYTVNTERIVPMSQPVCKKVWTNDSIG